MTRIFIALVLIFCLTPVAVGQDADFEESDAVTYPLDETELKAAHEAYLKRSDLQLERPEYEPEEIEVQEPPGWLKALGDFLNSIFRLLAPILQLAFYGALGLAAAGILYFLITELQNIRFGKDGSDDDSIGDDILVDLRPDAKRAKSLLEEADALAKAGRYAEAVHLLLFRSIEDIQENMETGVPKSLTAREIGVLKTLPERVRGALAPIIRIVEFSFWGGEAVNEDGWQTARASYESFAFGKAWA